MTKAKTQICTICNIEKSVREFNGYRNSKEIGGWSYDQNCKPCSPDKLCVRCNKRKLFVEFRGRDRKGKRVYEAVCIECETVENKIRLKRRYENKGRQEFLDKYHGDSAFRKQQLENSKAWEKKNAEYRREYRARPKQKKRVNDWLQAKRRTDPAFKIREQISLRIRQAINKYGGHKNNKSILDHLPYSMFDLTQHLESKFESWMNWKNHGRYNPETWNDNDSSTWTWQIDHVIPHSDLPYDSMEHPNFKKCWNLDNIRPLNAKQNLFDGTQRIRHKFTFK